MELAWVRASLRGCLSQRIFPSNSSGSPERNAYRHIGSTAFERVRINSPNQRQIGRRQFSRLLWAMKKAHVYGLLEDVSLYRFHYACASFKRVSARLDVNFRVQGKKFEDVVV